MLRFVIVGLTFFVFLRFMVVIYADHRALDRLGKMLDEVPLALSGKRDRMLKEIEGKLEEIRKASVWWRMLDLTTWQASGWFEWMKEEEGK